MSFLRRHIFVLCVLAALVAGLWLRRSALDMGFHGDDYVQIAMLEGKFPAPRSPLDLFRFADVERDGQSVIDFGYDPWWSLPNLKMAMFRPLSSALIAFDHRVFPWRPVAQHVHSMLWWVLMVGVCAWLFRMLLPLRVAVVALILFVLEEAHTVPLAWLANRSTLVSAAFGLLGLALHIRFRENPRPIYRAAEFVAFLLALLGGEYAFSVVVYAITFEWLAVRGDVRERVKALAPALGASLLCLVVGFIFGFGVRGSGYYISPLSSPFEFARAALDRVPVLAGDLVWGIPAAFWVDGMPGFSNLLVGRRWQHFIGLLALAAFALLTRYIEKRGQPERGIRWLAWGAALSLLPAAGALPEDRTLVAASVGACALFAIVLVEGYDAAVAALRTRHLPPHLLSIALAFVVAYVHLNLAWARSADQLRSLAWQIYVQRHWALDADIPDSEGPKRNVFIVTGADFTTIANLPFVRLGYRHPLPRSYERLSGALHVHEIVRTADNVIELAVWSNELEQSMVGSLYRSQKARFHIGDSVKVGHFRVEVQRVEGPHPWRTRFTFQHSLDSPEYLFLHPGKEGLRRFKMPPVGQNLVLPPPARPHL
jgi:hypothetical protein